MITGPITAKHAIVSDECRIENGDEGAIEISLDRLRAQALTSIGKHPIGTDWKFHFLLQVERPSAAPEPDIRIRTSEAPAQAAPAVATDMVKAQHLFDLAEQWADARVDGIRKNEWGPSQRETKDALWEACKALAASPAQEAPAVAAYESAFMDGLAWMLANHGSKPSEWYEAAADFAKQKAQPPATTAPADDVREAQWRVTEAGTEIASADGKWLLVCYEINGDGLELSEEATEAARRALEGKQHG